MNVAAVSFPRINGYAYYAYPKSVLLKWSAMTPALLPTLLMPESKGAIAMWRRVRAEYAALVSSWKERDPATMPARTLLEGVRELLAAGCGYYSSVQAVIPICATAELTFTNFYTRTVRRLDDPPAEVFLIGFDSTPIAAERSLAAMIPLAGDADALAGAVHEHLDRFGHLLYNLDFANPTPADDPEFVTDTVRRLAREGARVDERQRRSADERAAATQAVRGRLDVLRRLVFDRLLRAAQRRVPLREDALADVGLGWPTIRVLLGELGRRLVDSGALADADDVYWLTAEEADEAAARLDGGHAVLLGDGHELTERRALWRAQRRLLPPGIQPEGGWAQKLQRWMPTGSESQTGDTITGLGASAGVVTAPARLISGPADFSSLQPGEVLVASITTPAYTSLFALASAVVTDVGGPLSHSSIVAREYRIPAVLGTAVATRRIRTGMEVTVDGDRGIVTLRAGSE